MQRKNIVVFYCNPEIGDASKLQSQHVSKIRLILTRLDAGHNTGRIECSWLWFTSVEA